MVFGIVGGRLDPQGRLGMAKNLPAGFSGRSAPTASSPQPSGLPAGHTQYEASVDTTSGERNFLKVDATLQQPVGNSSLRVWLGLEQGGQGTRGPTGEQIQRDDLMPLTAFRVQAVH